MTSIKTERITYRIVRDDGDVMETGFSTRAAAAEQLHRLYDESEYFVQAWAEWVDAVPLPLYRRPTLRARLAALVLRRPQPGWTEVR